MPIIVALCCSTRFGGSSAASGNIYSLEVVHAGEGEEEEDDDEKEGNDSAIDTSDGDNDGIDETWV